MISKILWWFTVAITSFLFIIMLFAMSPVIYKKLTLNDQEWKIYIKNEREHHRQLEKQRQDAKWAIENHEALERRFERTLMMKENNYKTD